MRASYTAAHAVIFVSHGNRDTIASVVGLDGVRHVVIPNGVDHGLLEPYRKRDLRPRKPALVISVARLSPEKSLDTLVTATSRMPGDLVQQVNIFGEGPARHPLENQAARLGLNHRLRLRTWTTKVASKLSRHDVFVLPSLAEGMPYALLEAMAVGIPVVATKVSGNVEALAGGALGRLVPRSDPRALAEAIRNCIEDPEGSAAMARAALDYVRTHHNRTAAMDATAHIWQDLPANS